MTSSATEQAHGGLLDSPLEELIRLVLVVAPVVVEDPAVAVAARASARVVGDQLGRDGLCASRSCNVCTRIGTAALVVGISALLGGGVALGLFFCKRPSKRPSGEWGAGAAGAEPGPKGAGAAQAGPGGAGRWIKQ